MQTAVRRGDIYYADLSPVVGSEQGGIRPVLIVQNDTGNKFSPTVIAAAITSQIGKARLPTHIELSARSYGLSRDSVILLRERMGQLDGPTMARVEGAMRVSFGLISAEAPERPALKAVSLADLPAGARAAAAPSA